MNINVPALVVLLLGIIATVFFVAAAAETDWSHFTNNADSAKTGPFRAESGGVTYRYNKCSAGSGIDWTGSDCNSGWLFRRSQLLAWYLLLSQLLSMAALPRSHGDFLVALAHSSSFSQWSVESSQ